MSVPARTIAPRPRAPAAPQARPPAARPTPSTPPQRRARRGTSPAFWLLAAVVVSSLVLLVVSLNAMAVNTTYRMTEAQERAVQLQERHDELEVDVARLSSPSRIAEWAELVGMVAPAAGESVILRVPGERDARRGGDGSAGRAGA